MPGRSLSRSWIWVLLAVLTLPAVVGWAWLRAADKTKVSGAEPGPGLEWVEVRRVDLDTSLVAGGDLQAVKEAVITCQVEDITDTEGMMIISMVENGRRVSRGDELCRLDASELEELARQQEIQVNQAHAASTQARLRLETAQLALREYRDGLILQMTNELEGRIALGRSDVQKLRDHREWTERMVAKGYASRAQLASERQAFDKAQHELRKTEGELELFRKFQVPKELLELQGEIKIGEHNQILEDARLKSASEDLAYIRQQIDRCVIRAPQNGIAVHTMRGFWRRTPLQPGVRVFENQELFKIPDLSRMEVEASVNESMGPRVKAGMKAEVQVASLGGRWLPGTVSSVAVLSSSNDKEWDERIRHFIVHVRLDVTPPHVLPLMSAVVKIDTGRVHDALVIPVTALITRHHRQWCRVIGLDGAELRPIVTRHATADLLEVVEGLREGERVVLWPDSSLQSLSERPGTNCERIKV